MTAGQRYWIGGYNEDSDQDWTAEVHLTKAQADRKAAELRERFPADVYTVMPEEDGEGAD